MIGDFAENYSFTVQDAAQGWHWVNTQATLHPFCIYYNNPETGKIAHRSFCVISNHMTHNTAAVYAFQKTLIKYIKENMPDVRKINYFSDGCTGQYRNRKNFCNVCNHEADFGLTCT